MKPPGVNEFTRMAYGSWGSLDANVSLHSERKGLNDNGHKSRARSKTGVTDGVGDHHLQRYI
jgi:hypothetical protein